jgi:hypothetical protein
MDWNQAIARNLTALLRIADALCAMAGIGAEAAPGADRASWPASLPRHLHTAVLGVLRPAESALRRLIVIAARDLVVVLPPAERARLAKALPTAQTSRTGIFWHDRPIGAGDLTCLSRDPHMTRDRARDIASDAAPGIAPGGVSGGRKPGFALFDPLKRFGAVRQGPSQTIPRILFNLDTPPDLPARPAASPEDPVSATQLCRRLSALKHALDDLPAQAKRLARWRARRRVRARGRLSPMRPGSPPGHRRGGFHPVDDVLHRCHGLAIDAVARRDTS